MDKKNIPYGHQTITQEDIDTVTEVLQSDFLTQGPKLNEFEKQVANYHNAKYGVAFSNGTAALHGAYYAAGIHAGDEIITSPITFAATSNAAIYCGAKPVFADIDLETNCINPEEVEKNISLNTKAITPVSLAGYPVDLKNIRAIADSTGKKCYVIHDAAHAIGSRRKGTFGLEYADMAILSFHPVKHIATGEGGMVLTNNQELYDRLKLFRSHGIVKNYDNRTNDQVQGPWYYEMVSLGFNYRLTEIQAALGISQFKRIQENLVQRNEIAKEYGEAFKYNSTVIIPPQIGFDILKDPLAENIHSYHLYTLRLSNPEKRLDFYYYLHKHGILAQIHYIPVYWHPFYRDAFGYKMGDYPKAEEYYASEISIPMYHNMKNEDKQYIIDIVNNYKDK